MNNILISKQSIPKCATPTMSNCLMNCCMVTIATNHLGICPGETARQGHSKARWRSTPILAGNTAGIDAETEEPEPSGLRH